MAITLMQSIIKVIEYYRVRDWIKTLGVCILGLIATKVFLNPIVFLFGILQSCLLFSFLFSVDDLCDSFIEKKKKSSKSLKKEALFLATPLILSFIISIVFFSEGYFAVYLIFLFFTITYSYPKIRMDDKPFFDVIYNVILFSLLFSQAVLFNGNTFSATSLILFFWFASYVFSLELIHQLSHFSEDINSTAIFLGKIRTLKLLKYSFLVELFISLIFFLVFPNVRVFAASMTVFSFVRFLYARKFIPKTNFADFRNRMGGLVEGLVYLLILLAQSF